MPTGPAAPAWLRTALVALLIGELLYLTITFDTQSLDRTSSVWTLLAGWSSQYVRVAIAALGALSVLVVTGLVSRNRVTPVTRQRVSGGWLLFHLAAFASFIWLTRRFFTGTDVAESPAAWTITWALTGAAMIASWAVATFPEQRWWVTAAENRLVMGASLAFGTAIWGASFVSERLWVPLARFTFRLVTSVLGLFYAETVNLPGQLIVGTPQFKVQISPECSGYEGIGLILAFLSIYLSVFRKELRFPSALILLPIGAALMWTLNVGRIVALIAIGSSGWPAVAQGGFHSQAGWLTFNAVALAFVALTNRAGYFKRQEQAAADEARLVKPTSADSTIASLSPFVALLGMAMVTGAVSAGFDWLYGVRIAAAAGVLYACRDSYRRLTWTCSWEACAIGCATAVMWIATFPLSVAQESSWPASLQSVGSGVAALWLAVRFAGYVFVVPLVEELAFRVYATRRLMSNDIDSVPVGAFTVASFVISSLLFGALHGALWIQGTVAGMAFAFLLYRRRSVGDAVLAHATTNAVIALYVFTTGRWSLWS
jgi:exosortase E/protease (VPEID-CTERM system)